MKKLLLPLALLGATACGEVAPEAEMNPRQAMRQIVNCVNNGSADSNLPPEQRIEEFVNCVKPAVEACTGIQIQEPEDLCIEFLDGAALAGRLMAVTDRNSLCTAAQPGPVHTCAGYASEEGISLSLTPTDDCDGYGANPSRGRLNRAMRDYCQEIYQALNWF